MNKIIASTGLVALSAVGIQAAYAPGQSAQDNAKSWSLNAGLQGFYDSNSTATLDANRIESWGVGFDIGAGYSLPLDQTFLGIDYTYGLKWYEARPNNNTDQTHTFNLKLDHAFSERYNVSVKDSFVYSREPTVLDAGGAITARTQGDGVRNRGNIDFLAQLTDKWGLNVGYENNWYDYKQSAGDIVDPRPPGALPPISEIAPSRSQLLDRMQHRIPIDARWTMSPKWVGLVGYQYERADYNSNDAYNTPYGLAAPDWRNFSAHYGYLGGEYAASSQLNFAFKGGVQYTMYENLQTYSPTADDSQVTPYADVSVSYLYNPGSYITGGYSYGLTATDVRTLNNKTHVVYLALTHKITSRVDANVLYQFQNSSFNDNGTGTMLNGGSENFNILGIDFSYKITENLSAQVGYKYDNLTSDIAFRTYDRHIGFVGLRANY